LVAQYFFFNVGKYGTIQTTTNDIALSQVSKNAVRNVTKIISLIRPSTSQAITAKQLCHLRQMFKVLYWGYCIMCAKSGVAREFLVNW